MIIIIRGSQPAIEHPAFRDALRSDGGLRDQYAALKYDLAQRYKNDRAKYSESKTEFMQHAAAKHRLSR